MAVQTSYTATIRAGLPGMIVDMIPKTLISRTVQAAGGLAFGVPVIQGTADKAGRASTTGDTAAKFVGISVRDRSVKAEANQYSQYESARVMTKGAIWVTASVQVAAGDPVYFVPATGVWTNVATDNVLVANARFDTSTTGANQLAQVRLG
ncbi:DUF2190 family protein [Pseudomonas sp. BW13M1]|uniref:DUF2190 family protein n=1 Tax=Pseudomonas peradeniyensis TaxID=2745488 RepID=A0A923JZI4_9PSED|nr:DUF2190 family protein [Pseudomonas peradeniyensis]MBV4507696.1 DUF2190 family protein [Pseudomonas peradeniyensis]